MDIPEVNIFEQKNVLKAPAKVPMIIRLSKRDLSRLLNEGSLGREAGELRLANRLSKRSFETVN